MCGRFALSAKTESVEKLIHNLVIDRDIIENTNFAPTSSIPIVRNFPERELDYAFWGLIPSWAKDKSFGKTLFNARSETVAEKPSFRTAFKRRRCLVIADAFYEWKKIEGKKKKEKYIIKLKSGEPFTFAGLWEIWKSEEGNILSATILTTEPNETLSQIHNRMPVILPQQAREEWLYSGEVDSPEMLSLLKPYPDEEMEMELVE